MVNIIHTIPSIAEEVSGPTYSVKSLCKYLNSSGYSSSIVALDRASITALPPYLKTFPLAKGPRRLGRSPPMKHWLYRQCKTKKVDIIHNHGMWMMSTIYPAWAIKKGKHAKLIQSPRGAFSAWAMHSGSKWKPFFWKCFQLPALQRVACFHATAEAEYQDIRRLGFKQPVAIIPNGITIPEKKHRAIKRSRTLLFLGRIHPVKGLDMLLPAWQALQKDFPEWDLKIVGNDDIYYASTGYLQACKEQAKQLALERIEFHSSLYGEDKIKAYADAELFVLPSYSENFAMTVAESLAAGTPVVVTKGAPWQGLDGNGAGWWIDIHLDALVCCLRSAMSKSPIELAKKGDLGREWMKKDFSWELVTTRMLQTYHWLFDKSLSVPQWVKLH
jgi:glycosyltransferase involved in cell wall biosynthesis